MLVAGEIGLFASFWWVFKPLLWLAGNVWALWPLFVSWTCNLVLEVVTWFLNLDLVLGLENLGLKSWFLGLSKNKEKEPNIPTNYGSACWQLDLLGKANFNGCTDLGVKGLDSMLLHYFSAAGIPTSADECLEAVQSNLTGPMLFF